MNSVNPWVFLNDTESLTQRFWENKLSPQYTRPFEDRPPKTSGQKEQATREHILVLRIKGKASSCVSRTRDCVTVQNKKSIQTLHNCKRVDSLRKSAGSARSERAQTT